MRIIDYGFIHIKLDRIIKNQKISINHLANRAEMQHAQLKSYIKGDILRADLRILARLCYVLECDLSELIEYVRPAE